MECVTNAAFVTALMVFMVTVVNAVIPIVLEVLIICVQVCLHLPCNCTCSNHTSFIPIFHQTSLQMGQLQDLNLLP